MTNAEGRKKTRAERLSMPLARDVVKDLAVEHGAGVRPIQLRRTDLATGQTEPVLVPCGHTLASVCRPAPNARRTCGPRSAGRAGTSTKSRSSTRTTPPAIRNG